MTVVEYMLYSTENLLFFFLCSTPKGMNNINMICENIHVAFKFISSFLVSSYVWTDCSSLGSRASKECYTAMENQ